MTIGRKHLCDECGREIGATCHECIHKSSVVVVAINEILPELDLNNPRHQRLHRKLSNFKEFNERRFLELNRKGGGLNNV